MNTALMIAAIVIYMAFMIYVGVRTSIANKNSDDFYLGGRQLGPLVTAMSAEASDMSSWLLMGLPGVALTLNYTGAFAEAVWTAVGLAIGTYLNWLITAKRIRKYTEKLNANTLPDFFSARFNDKSGILTLIAAIITIVFFVPYTGSGFASVGKLFNSLFGVDYHIAMIVGAAIVAIYTVLGGFLAASFTDLIQSVIMTIALVTVIAFGFTNAGSVENLFAPVNEIKNYFSLTGTDGSYGILPIASTLAWGLGYFGLPTVLLRFMAIKDEKKLKLSRRIASIWVVISMGMAIFIGVIGYSFMANHPEESFDPERILVYMSNALSEFGWLLALVAGLIIAGILASIMSTADSQMLAASSSMSENIIHRFIWKNMSDKAQMWFARLTVVLVSVVGVFFAWDPNSSVFRIVSFAWAGFGAAFGPVVLFSLFWRRTTKWGALAGLASGGIMIFVWKYLVRPLGGLWNIYELLPAFIISCIFIFVVSLLTPAPDKSITDVFDSVKNEN